MTDRDEGRTDKVAFLERRMGAMVRWLEENEPHVFRAGLWDAIYEADEAEPSGDEIVRRAFRAGWNHRADPLFGNDVNAMSAAEQWFVVAAYEKAWALHSEAMTDQADWTEAEFREWFATQDPNAGGSDE